MMTLALNSKEAELAIFNIDENNLNEDIKKIQKSIGENKAFIAENLTEIFNIFHRIADVSKSRKKFLPLCLSIPKNQQRFIGDVVARIEPAVFLDQSWEDLPREQLSVFCQHFKMLRVEYDQKISAWREKNVIKQGCSAEQPSALEELNSRVYALQKCLSIDIECVVRKNGRFKIGAKDVVRAQVIAAKALKATNELLQNPTEDQLKIYNATAESMSDFGQERTGQLMVLAGCAVMAAAVIGAIILPASIGPAVLLGSFGLFVGGAALSFAGLAKEQEVRFANRTADKMKKCSEEAGASLISMGKNQ